MSEKDTQEMRELFLFELMTDDDLQALMPILREKFYGAGTKIFSEKERGETMFVIKKGSVKIVKQDGDVQKELITFSAGDFFGEVTLFEYAMRTASAFAVEDTTLLEIARTDFTKLFSQKPQVTAKILFQMMTEMSRRLRRKNMPSGGLIL